MLKNFKSLGFNSVFRTDNEGRDVGYIRATGANATKGFVSRGIKESDVFPSTVFRSVGNLISTRMLSDASRLRSRHVGFPDVVDESRLAMVDVP